jgi:hypothetical protein
MTVGRISAICWTVFVIMSIAFLPVALGIMSIHALPQTPRIVLAVVVVAALWWGPFAYAMYLAMVVVKNGDKRLLKRGIQGTAEVLSGKATNEVIQSGEFAWEAPRVYKYRLRVSIPGKAPYETDCRICARGIQEGATVHVAASPQNHKRVTIDVGQGSAPGRAAASAQAARSRARPFAGEVPHLEGRVGVTGQGYSAGQGLSASQGHSASAERLDELEKLGQLHSQGVLSDAEFAAEKARILGE